MNLSLDERLVADAQKLGGHKTKKGAVTAALREYVSRQRRLGILALEGTVDFRDDFDSKAFRGGPRRDRPSKPRNSRDASPGK